VGNQASVPKVRSRLSLEDRREHLVRTAVKVFAQDGIGGASILKITQTAGVSNGTFYHYFSNKEELEEAVGALIVQDLATKIRDDQSGLGPAERIASGAVGVLRRVAADPELGSIMAEYFEQQSLVLRQTADSLDADVVEGMGTGIFVDSDPSRFFVGMIIAMFGSACREVLAGKAADEMGERVAAAQLRMLGLGTAEAAQMASWAVLRVGQPGLVDG